MPHPRTVKVSEAESAIAKVVRDQIRKQDLSYAEITAVLLSLAQEWNRYALRDEREKPK